MWTLNKHHTIADWLGAGIVFAVLATCITLLAGCTTIDKQPIVAQLAVERAVYRLIGSGVEPDQIIKRVEQLRQLVDESGEIKPRVLAAVVIDEIDWSEVSARDRPMLKTLIVAVGDELARDVSVDQDAALRLLILLDWIDDAAVSYKLLVPDK